MENRFAKLRYFAICLLMPLFAHATINGKADYQFWERVILKKGFSEEGEFVLRQEARFGDDVSKLYYTYLQGLFSYNAAKWCSMAVGYRQIYQRAPLSSSHFQFAYSPLADLTFKTSSNGWKLSDRSRVQYIITESSSSSWLYRNMVRIVTPWEVTSFKAQPYFENEFFWRQDKGINENRTTIGLRDKLTKHVSMDGFYMARLLEVSNSWNYINVFGINLVLSY